MRHSKIEQPTLATKQVSIKNQGDSGWETNRHFLMWEYLTQTPIGISTKHSLNATSKMKRKRNTNTMKEFDHGSFTPVVFSIYGSMGRECRTFYNRLGKKIPEKQELHQSIVTNWIVTKISFALLKSALLCLRGAKDLEHF